MPIALRISDTALMCPICRASLAGVRPGPRYGGGLPGLCSREKPGIAAHPANIGQSVLEDLIAQRAGVGVHGEQQRGKSRATAAGARLTSRDTEVLGSPERSRTLRHALRHAWWPGSQRVPV